MIKLLKTATILAAALCLASCSLGGGRKAAERYSLVAHAVEAPVCRGNISIKFHTPNAAPGIDTWRIVVMDKPNHLTFYQGVAWSATAARQVQHFLADSFEQSGMFSTVSTDLDTVPADYDVEMELRAFHIDLTDGEPQVRIRLTANITRADGARVLKTLVLTRNAPTHGAKMEGIVAIFAEQMHSISQELQERLGKAIPGCRR